MADIEDLRYYRSFDFPAGATKDDRREAIQCLTEEYIRSIRQEISDDGFNPDDFVMWGKIILPPPRSQLAIAFEHKRIHNLKAFW